MRKNQSLEQNLDQRSSDLKTALLVNDSDSPKLESILVSPFVENILIKLEDKILLSGAIITLAIDPALSILSDRTMASSAIANVIVNSLQSKNKMHTVRMSISAIPGPGQLTLEIEDYEVGLEFEQYFDKISKLNVIQMEKIGAYVTLKTKQDVRTIVRFQFPV